MSPAFLALLLAAAPVAKEAPVSAPPPAVPELVATLGGARWLGDGEVSAVAWSPDGKLVASGGAEDKAIALWDAASGARVGSLGPKTKPTQLAFTPDGRLLLSANLYQADVWDVAARKLVSSQAGGGSVHHAALTADGGTLATAGLNGLRLWALPSGKEIPLAGKVETSGPVAFSADGHLLAAAKTRGGIALWDLGSGKAAKEAGKEHSAALAFAGDALLSGEAGALVVRDARTLRERAALRGHKGTLYGISVSRDGKAVATADNEGEARLWDLASGKALQTVKAEGPFWSVAIAPDGSALAAAGRARQLKVWRGPAFALDGGDAAHADGVRALAFTPDGATLLSADSAGVLVEWDAKALTVRRRLSVEGSAIADLAMRPDGSQAIVRGYTRAWRWTPGGAALEELALPGSGVTWSPDGKLLAVSDSSRIVSVVDAKGTLLRTFGEAQEHDGERQNLSSPSATAFSPDAGQLAVARWDQPVTVWDVASGKRLRTLPGTLNVDWSSDGKLIAVDLGRVSKRMEKLELQVLDAATGTARYTVPYPGARFSPDGRLLAAIDAGHTYPKGAVDPSAVVLLQASDGKGVARLSAEGHRPGAFAFSADGKTLATGGMDATVRIWRIGR